MRRLLWPLLFAGVPCLGQWSTLGTGMDNPVRDVLYDADAERLYAVGGFRTAGGDTMNGAAWWDGATWHAMGQGLQPDANGNTIAKRGVELVVGGAFEYAGTAANTFKLACWTDETWMACPPGVAPNKGVIRAQFVDSLLYISGGFASVGAVQADNVAVRQNGAWQPVVRVGLLDTIWGVSCVERYQGDLYIAGNLMASNGLSDIGRVVGDSLVGVGQGILGDPWVNDMIVYNGLLWVGGYFFQGAGNAASMLMCWNGSEWFDPFPQVEVQQQVRRFLIHEGSLYFAAAIHLQGESSYHPLARFDGENLCLLGGTGGLVYAMAGNDDQLYCSVSYDPFGPDSLDANWIASLDLTYPADTCLEISTGVSEIPEGSFVGVSPNPTNGLVYLAPLRATGKIFYVQLVDVMGRTLMHGTMSLADGPYLDLTRLPAGSYRLRVNNEDQMRSTTIVKY